MKYIVILGVIVMVVFCVSGIVSAQSEKSSLADIESMEFEGDTYTRLEGDTLLDAIINKAIYSNSDNFREYFYKDGKYYFTGALIPMNGIYTISGNEVCIRKTGAQKDQCKPIFKNTKGEYITIDLFKDKKPQMPNRIYIKPIS